MFLLRDTMGKSETVLGSISWYLCKQFRHRQFFSQARVVHYYPIKKLYNLLFVSIHNFNYACSGFFWDKFCSVYFLYIYKKAQLELVKTITWRLWAGTRFINILIFIKHWKYSVILQGLAIKQGLKSIAPLRQNN